jgi:hypothetical protein
MDMLRNHQRGTYKSVFSGKCLRPSSSQWRIACKRLLMIGCLPVKEVEESRHTLRVTYTVKPA